MSPAMRNPAAKAVAGPLPPPYTGVVGGERTGIWREAARTWLPAVAILVPLVISVQAQMLGMQRQFGELQGEFGVMRVEFRDVLRAELGALRSDLEGQIGALRDEVGALREEVRELGDRMTRVRPPGRAPQDEPPPAGAADRAGRRFRTTDRPRLTRAGPPPVPAPPSGGAWCWTPACRHAARRAAERVTLPSFVAPWTGVPASGGTRPQAAESRRANLRDGALRTRHTRLWITFRRK